MSQPHQDEVVRFSESVKKELSEMAKLGTPGAAGAIAKTADMVEMEDLLNMQVSECADLLITLSGGS